MRPKLELYEREEEEIEADYSAGLISLEERNKAIKNLWADFNASYLHYAERRIEDYPDWYFV